MIYRYLAGAQARPATEPAFKHMHVHTCGACMQKVNVGTRATSPYN